VEPKEEPEAGDPARPAGSTSVVHGYIRDAESAPVGGATVTLRSKGGRQLDRVTSLADGSYILSVPAPGTYLLAATAVTYGTRARQVTVEDGPLVYDMELTDASEEEVEADADAVN
jgi:RND superfamily putative drug exporter